MRKLTFLIFTITFCIPLLYADDIKLEPKDPPKTGTGSGWERTELVVPSASIDDGVVTIETELATWGVAVTIYSSDGTVVYTSVSPVESKSHEFAVGTLAEGEYIIEVLLGEEYYEGEFAL